MPRNISFALTTKQVRDQTKDVTRRIGWWFLKPGDILQPIEKGQGLKKGETVTRVGGPVRVISVRREKLLKIKRADVVREGFPEWRFSKWKFIDMFCKHNRCEPDTEVNRIEFEYI